MGLTCHIGKNHREVEKNAREIKEYLEEVYLGFKKRVLGHSKGGVDAAAALSTYWPDLRDEVAGLALAQSPYGGSLIAPDIMREGQIGDYFSIRKLKEIFTWKVIKEKDEAIGVGLFLKMSFPICKKSVVNASSAYYSSSGTRRGQATDPHSIAERTDKATMLDEILDYVKFLQLQVKVLSMSRLSWCGGTPRI